MCQKQVVQAAYACAVYQERDVKMRKLGGFPKCHFFNTFFVNKLYKWVTLNLCSMIACVPG